MSLLKRVKIYIQSNKDHLELHDDEEAEPVQCSQDGEERLSGCIYVVLVVVRQEVKCNN